MYEVYFIFPSLTQAQSAINMLRRHGINSVLTKAPGSYAAEGCTHAVKVRYRDEYAADSVLASAQFSYRRTTRYSDRIPAGEDTQ